MTWEVSVYESGAFLFVRNAEDPGFAWKFYGNYIRIVKIPCFVSWEDFIVKISWKLKSKNSLNDRVLSFHIFQKVDLQMD